MDGANDAALRDRATVMGVAANFNTVVVVRPVEADSPGKSLLARPFHHTLPIATTGQITCKLPYLMKLNIRPPDALQMPLQCEGVPPQREMMVSPLKGMHRSKPQRVKRVRNENRTRSLSCLKDTKNVAAALSRATGFT